MAADDDGLVSLGRRSVLDLDEPRPSEVKNIERDPRVTVLVDAPPRETSVAAYGRAEATAYNDDAYEGALAIISRYVEDARAYLVEGKSDPRVLIRIRPDRIVSSKL